MESRICARFVEISASEKYPDWFVTTKNGDIYHSTCITEWMRQGNPNCPNCNLDLDENHLTQIHGVKPTHKQYHNTMPRSNKILKMMASVPKSTQSVRKAKLNPMIPQDFDYSLTLCMLGAIGTGKSSLLESFTTGSFCESIGSTIGKDLKTKHLAVGDKTVNLNLWDTSGQERFNAVSRNFVRNAHGVLIVFSYDKDKGSILASIDTWVKFIEENGLPGAAVLLVGNKIDLLQEKCSKFTAKKALALARSLGMTFFETSAKDNVNVEAAFMALVAEIIQRIETNQLKYKRPDQGQIKLDEMPNKKRGHAVNKKIVFNAVVIYY